MKKVATFYVDDDPDDIAFFVEAVRDLEVELVVFTGGATMLHAMVNPPPIPAIIFVDLNMPQMNGYEVVQHIRASKGFGNLPIMILSTTCTQQHIEQAMEAGANYYITKPANIGDLKRAIEFAVHTDWETFKPAGRDFVHKHPYQS